MVRIDGPWSDYKGNPIEPNVFTMRYGIRPEDGNHMGVSVHLDYVLLVPVAEDMTVDRRVGPGRPQHHELRRHRPSAIRR